jgi:DNA processing protein
MELADLVALSRLPLLRRRLVDAVRLADAVDGRLVTALDSLGNPEGADALRAQAATALGLAQQKGIRPLAWDSADYPPALTTIPDPPLVVWIRGAALDWSPLAVAVVGARAASSASREVARDLGKGLALAGVTVVSGLARGCDGAAHQGALAAGGRTIAVLGCGVDVTYPPEHETLAQEIALTGALLSELAPGTPPLPHHFPLRNRIIAGLSRAVVVIEAHERSGSLITAACALEQGREVMVVPGPVRSGRNRGAHALLKDGAALVESAADVLAELGAAVPQCRSAAVPQFRSAAVPQCRSAAVPQCPDAAASQRPGATVQQSRTAAPQHCSTAALILSVLDPDEALDLDDLQGLTALDLRVLTRYLTELELAGLAVRQPGGRFVRSLGK